MHSDRRLGNLEFNMNNMEKFVKEMNHFNQQDHKTLQDALHESMTQVNDWRNRLAQDIATLKASCASLMDEQRVLQVQVKQLRYFHAKASPELADLSAAHRGLEARHGGLCDCLAGSGTLEVAKLHARSRVRGGLASLDAALSKPEVLRAVVHFSGERGAAVARLASANPCFAGARTAVSAARAAGGLAPAEEVASAPQVSASAAAPVAHHDLDDGSWRSLEDFEPSKEVLNEWAKNEMVQHAFGNFGVQGIMGAPEVMNYSDVYGLFGQIELTLEQFVNKFTYLPVYGGHKESALKLKADAILRRMALEKSHGEQRITSRDVYRLLELVGFPLSRFRAIFKSDDDGEDKPDSRLKIGSYRIRRQIGQGFHGVCCYLGERATDSSERVAIKWPASKEEIAALEDIHSKVGKNSESCLGVPRLVDHGSYEGQPYLVQELLGSTLASVFETISHRPPASRWAALRLVGRLVVRRLQSLHESGYVHCDISPDNILVGHMSQSEGGGSNGTPRLTLYLIDFELAQKYPGGAKLTPDQGSAEWSSIRSADGGERLPEDDLEAIGWVLLNGLGGALPWFDWLQSAYKDWDSKWVRRQATKQVQRAKMMVLEDGCAALPSKKPLKVPEDLRRFLRACRQPRPEAAQGKPDYKALLTILGARADLEPKEADRRDLLEFEALVREVNRPSADEAASRRRLAQVRQELDQAVASKDRGQLHAALRKAVEAGIEGEAAVRQAESILQNEEARDKARASLQEAVASCENRRICAALREAELAGLPEEEMAGARTMLDEGDNLFS